MFENIPYQNKLMIGYSMSLGEDIANFMKQYETIGVFPSNFSSITRWTLSLFHMNKEENSTLFVPYFYCGTTSLNEEENRYDYYDAVIFIDVKTNQKEDKIIFEHNEIEFNNKKIPTLNIIYCLEKNENDSFIYDDIFNPLLLYKKYA